jgi:hypothetical protein
MTSNVSQAKYDVPRETDFARWMQENDVSIDLAVRLFGYNRSTICAYRMGRKRRDRQQEMTPREPDLVLRLAMAAVAAGIREPAAAFASRDVPMRTQLALTAAALRLPPQAA